jgi:hypothetical protein
MVAAALFTLVAVIEVRKGMSKSRMHERDCLNDRMWYSAPSPPEDRDQIAAPTTQIARKGAIGADRMRYDAPLTRSGTEEQEFNRAVGVAATNGDFIPLSEFFDSLSQLKREEFFRRVPSIFSKLGPTHDIREKMALLEKVNAYASRLENMRMAVLEWEAMERYDQMKEEGVLIKLTNEEFAAVCRRIAMNRVKKAFAAVEDADNETTKRIAAAAVARSVIAGGTMAASKAIGELPAGVVRDEAVAELVLWLRQTNSESEAAPWEAVIADETTKSRILMSK